MDRYFDRLGGMNGIANFTAQSDAEGRTRQRNRELIGLWRSDHGLSGHSATGSGDDFARLRRPEPPDYVWIGSYPLHQLSAVCASPLNLVWLNRCHDPDAVWAVLRGSGLHRR